MRVSPKTPYPDSRIIVFAGVSSSKTRANALATCRVNGVMASFMLVQSGKWWKGLLPLFDSWPQYRYLDSGAFSFLRKGGGTRIRITTAGGNLVPRVALTPKQLSDAVKLHFDSYVSYLRQNLDDWDFVFDMDVDTLNFGSVSGVEVTQTCRRALRRVVGDKLIPVWHPIAGVSSWKELVSEYAYVAIGSDLSPTAKEVQERCGEAHESGVLVHGLGTSRVDVMQIAPFDTVDSTTWLASTRFGQFGGVNYRRDYRRQSQKELRKARFGGLEDLTKELGYDLDELTKTGTASEGVYVTAIHIIQKREGTKIVRHGTMPDITNGG